MFQFINLAGRGFVTATVLGTLLAVVPLHGGQAQHAASTVQTVSTTTDAKHAADRSEKRIAELHAKLHITAAQEPLWSNVAQAMRDNIQAMRASMTDRSTRLRTMTAIDDLKSYQVVADQHSEGLKHLIPAFEALYASMTPDQQKHADHVFGEHQPGHHAHS